MINAAIIVAGGSGSRMKSSVRKQYMLLDDMPVLSRTLQVFDRSDVVDEIVLVVPEADLDFCRDKIVAPLSLNTNILFIPGGSERQESVLNGLNSLSPDTGLVLIHDGVRPFVSEEQVRDVVSAAVDTGAAILAIPASDTLKRVDESGVIRETLPRHDVWLAQTPQAFRPELIMEAHKLAVEAGFMGTDDASLVEHAGGRVTVVPGSRINMKITTPEDVILASALLAAGRVA